MRLRYGKDRRKGSERGLQQMGRCRAHLFPPCWRWELHGLPFFWYVFALVRPGLVVLAEDSVIATGCPSQFARDRLRAGRTRLALSSDEILHHSAVHKVPLFLPRSSSRSCPLPSLEPNKCFESRVGRHFTGG